MKITGVVTFYSSNPHCLQLRTCVEGLKNHGKYVVIKPLSEMKQRKRPASQAT